MGRIVDLHMHVVPKYDDGSRSIEESIEMIECSIRQGVTDIFCTSHNACCEEDILIYNNHFECLKKVVANKFPDIRLYKGCELLCSDEDIDEIIHGLNCGLFPTLGGSKFVLTELYPDARLSEATMIIQKLISAGYKPIIAHMERNIKLVGPAVSFLISLGAYIQVNAFSFSKECGEIWRQSAKLMLENKQIHFIGSDSHGVIHRPPKLIEGINYITANTENMYASEIFYRNAENLLKI